MLGEEEEEEEEKTYSVFQFITKGIVSVRKYISRKYSCVQVYIAGEKEVCDILHKVE